MVEIHFIELPKFRALKEKNYKDEALLRWLRFLETDVDEEELEVLMQMEPAIRKAEEKLEHLSSDPEMLALYKAREDSAHERANLIATGIEKGKRERELELAKALLDVLDDATIATKIGLPVDEVMKLRKSHT